MIENENVLSDSPDGDGESAHFSKVMRDSSGRFIAKRPTVSQLSVRWARGVDWFESLDLLVLRTYPVRHVLIEGVSSKVAAACGRDATGVCGLVLHGAQTEIGVNSVVRITNGRVRISNGEVVINGHMELVE